MKLKIISDGTVVGSRVVVAETGEVLDNVELVEFRVAATGRLQAKMTFASIEVEISTQFPASGIDFRLSEVKGS